MNSSPLVLIEETEFILNNYFEEFAFIEANYPEQFAKCWKEIKTEKRKDNQKRTMDLKNETEKAIQEKRAQDKNSRKIKKIGKPLMRAIDKPPVKKVEVKKKTLTEDQVAEIKYIGL